MRNIVNISLPKELNKEVEKAVKSGRYASKSEFLGILFVCGKSRNYWMKLWKARRNLPKAREKFCALLRICDN